VRQALDPRVLPPAGRTLVAIEHRVAGEVDVEAVTGTLTSAFASDPVWGAAFPEPAELEVLWRLLIGSALRFPWTWIAGEYAAVALWIPPGQSELTEAEEERVEPLLTEAIGVRRAAVVLETLERFDGSHPRDRDHYYLSLLGTHPDHRGQGAGMDLLRTNLAAIDEEGAPAYLESTNPVNNARYESVGFRQVGEFTTPGGEATVATMWREPGATG
jgi:GNAT superfamily N-acetyltransferase